MSALFFFGSMGFMEPYDFIVAKVQEAGDILLAARDAGFETNTKKGDARDIVTSVDIAVNDFLKKEITTAFPGDSIYSEEGGAATASARLWIIDPIDGSANFSRGIPHFAICAGIMEAGVPVLGVVFNPVTHEMFSFKKGGGAFLNGKPIQVSTIAELKDAQIFLHAGRKPEGWQWGGDSYRKLLEHARKTTNLASSSLDTCFVAAGRAQGNIYGTLSTLDIAPALGILYEAGGVASNSKGEPLTYSEEPQRIYMANNQPMLDQLRTLLESN